MGSCFSMKETSRKPPVRRNCSNSGNRSCSHSEHLTCGSSNNQTTTKVSIEISPRGVAVASQPKKKEKINAPITAEPKPVKAEPIGWRAPDKIGQDNNAPYPLKDKMPQPGPVTERPDAPPPPYPLPQPTYLDSSYPGAQQDPQALLGDHDTCEQTNAPPIGCKVDIIPPYPLEDYLPKAEKSYPLTDYFTKP